MRVTGATVFLNQRIVGKSEPCSSEVNEPHTNCHVIAAAIETSLRTDDINHVKTISCTICEYALYPSTNHCTYLVVCEQQEVGFDGHVDCCTNSAHYEEN